MNTALTNDYQEKDRVNDDINKEHLVSNSIHLREALQRGISARKRMTENNPVTSGGQYFYSEVVRGLRELLKPLGYEKKSTRNVELTINKNKGIAIYLCSGCEQTGNPSGVPQSNTDKGDFTLELFGLNYDNAHNLDLFPELLPQSNPKNKLNCDIWFFLHYFDKSNNKLKAELARPISYDNKGYVTRFDLENRIFIDMDYDENINIEPDFNDKIDFEVEEVSKTNV
jgi:hypothetical protein